MTEQPEPRSSPPAAGGSPAPKGATSVISSEDNRPPRRRRWLGVFGKQRQQQPKPDKPRDVEVKAVAERTTPSPQQTGADPVPRQRKRLPTTRPPGAPPDPWTVFATIPDQPPSRVRRALGVTRRALVHEYALVIYAACLLAVLMTWPTLRYPLHTLPQDLGDPARQAWQIAWAGHILSSDPIRLWHSNAYYPEALSFGFGDSLLGYAPFGMLVNGPATAVLVYNILFVAAHALLMIGAYALVRQLGARPIGAAVAAVAFAYAPWRLAQEGHLDVISAGGIPLALAMLARGHGYSLRYGFRPARRHVGWAAAGWAVAIWQVSLGFSLGVPFAYVLGMILVVLLVASIMHGTRHEGRLALHRFLRGKHDSLLGWRLVATDTLGTTIFAGVALLIAVPYALVPDSGARLEEIRFFSPPLRSLLIGPAESRVWGASHVVPRSSLGWAAEMSLLPGFVLYALALAGLFFSIWRLRHRLLLFLGLVVAVVLTLGTTFFGGRWTYLPLFGHFPASFDLRIPGRLILWVTLILAVLAAGAVDDFVRRAEHLAAQRMPPWPGPWMRTAMLAPMVLVALEGWNATAHPVVPAQPAAMRTVSGPLLVLPTAEISDQLVQLWSTSRFEPMANGGGTFAGARQSELRTRVASFPDVPSIEYLRSIGISTVLLLRDKVVGTPWERVGDMPVDALGITREDLPDAVVFRLSRSNTTAPQPSGPGSGQQPGPGSSPQPGFSTVPQPGFSTGPQPPVPGTSISPQPTLGTSTSPQPGRGPGTGRIQPVTTPVNLPAPGRADKITDPEAPQPTPGRTDKTRRPEDSKPVPTAPGRAGRTTRPEAPQPAPTAPGREGRTARPQSRAAGTVSI